jgi:xanthine dehydrogenase accessory factor
VEAEVIDIAGEVFKAKGAVLRSFELKVSGAAESLDMLCGGRMTVLVEWVKADADNRRLYRTLYEGLQTGRKNLLVGILPDDDHTTGPIRRFLITEKGTVPDDFPLADDEREAILQKVGTRRVPVVADIAGRRFLMDPAAVSGTVYIFGAGHVSQALARLTNRVDFRTVVLDDRPEFANKERFPAADAIHVLDSFQTAIEGQIIDPDCYLVIITRGHSHDKTVLAQALGSEAGYIGMIGSRRKRDALYAALLEEGFTQSDLERVHSPIGLAIGAETPEEIAVSIVAELISQRAGSV